MLREHRALLADAFGTGLDRHRCSDDASPDHASRGGRAASTKHSSRTTAAYRSGSREPMTSPVWVAMARRAVSLRSSRLPSIWRSRARSDAGDPTGRSSDMYTRSEEHTSELQSLMRISYAVFCLKKKKKKIQRLR